ncbi:MAG: holo-ACP synthase [Magnetococcales bacterium]|nr:holo-ACP synthase [Magnetococcales bacterium]MBF0420512.1 holo-ACP synthase [Magnetococcales bacterium]
MIVGVGSDIVKMARLAQSVERFGERFLQKIFTADEIQSCSSKANVIACLAKRFAAKEAFVKALGTGMTQGIWFTDIQVIHDPWGRPGLLCSGGAEQRLATLGNVSVHLSLSDEAEYAVAFVIIETTNQVSSR